MTKLSIGIAVSLLFAASISHGGEAEVIDAKASCKADRCSFEVTLKHADTGWDHYANKWQILSDNGKILGERILLHPHVTEQPFTRSLSHIKTPKALRQIMVRGHDSVHGFNDKIFVVELPNR